MFHSMIETSSVASAGEGELQPLQLAQRKKEKRGGNALSAHLPGLLAVA